MLVPKKPYAAVQVVRADWVTVTYMGYVILNVDPEGIAFIVV